MTYDSQLEADWASTFCAWGIEFDYHPGWMLLKNGDRWEPDFMLEGDIVFEVKGEHDHRIDKAWRAASEYGLKVIVGRSGWIPAGVDIEFSGAVWEPEWWVLENRDGRLQFVDTRTVQPTGTCAFSASYAYAHGKSGVRWFKAVGDDGVA